MFIELYRTFHELSAGPESKRLDISVLFPKGESLNWQDLFKQYRIVILSEAGSGKTEEVRNAARNLRKVGKSAFFIRLEHVARDFEVAFEEGSYEEFQSWMASDEEGWLLLDSVDEARLRDPRDFEAAIRKLGFFLASAKQRVHVVITGRTSAWRPQTDLALCTKHLAFSLPTVSATTDVNSDGFAHEIRTEESATRREEPVFKVVALDDLSPGQVELFAKAKGVTNAGLFLDAVERADAWPFTSRPLDLEELVEFWTDHGRIGRRLELMRNSVDRRLSERDQDRAEARPLSSERARLGAKLIAAASTMTHESVILVPDGASNMKGLPIKSILTDWDDIECATLLARPIFDDAIYGTVRFHHRSVREYLTAEWLSDLLKHETSRRKIEALLFREQYGLEVVVPAMRPILPWLAIFDEKIRDRVRRVAPEVLFEGGDPSQLPIETRRQLLRQVCDQLASGASSRSMADHDAVQRFASPDLASEIKDLILKYESNDDLLWFLLRMIWLGEISDALPEAMRIAQAPHFGRYGRQAAFRAVSALGDESVKAALRRSFMNEPEPLDRDLLAELLADTNPTTDIIDWFFACIRMTDRKERYSVDNLTGELSKLVERADNSLLPQIIRHANALLEAHPVVERRHCEISEKFAWLLKAAGEAVERLIKCQDRAVFESSCLGVLHKLSISKQYDLVEVAGAKLEFGALVADWPELNQRLFWHLVDYKRQWLDRTRNERLTDWWSVSIWSSYVQFAASDFELVVNDVVARPFIDDKLVALSLAFKLYADGGRQPAQRKLLKKSVGNDCTLSARLSELMHPPPLSAESKKYKRMEADWARKSRRREAKKREQRDRWRKYVTENVEKLRNPGFDDPTALSNAQLYLHDQMRKEHHDELRKEHKGSSTWSAGNWQSLEGEFGVDVARALRDGAVAYWRRNKPKLISEGAQPNSVQFSTIFGLTGLAIEAREVAGWPNALNAADAELAFRYAMRELNGFPHWLPRLFSKFPDVIVRMSLQEIRHELATEEEEKESHYLLSDLNYTGDWLWDAIGPRLYETISAYEPKNLTNLDHILNIIQGSSSLSDERIARLASDKAISLERFDHAARWFATWTGVEPDRAIAAVEARINSLAGDEDRKAFAMIYVNALMGNRRDRSSRVRESYRSAHHLKTLYLLMHRYIRRQDDIDRSGGGVFSPGLRDNAQEARDQLFSLLKDIPGKDAFLAIEEISLFHPDEHSRPRFQLHAKTKAARDADNPPWSPQQVREFTNDHERTPSNHRDLFDLAAMRLSDLKDDLEGGDSSVARILQDVDDEIEIRKFIGNWCRQCSRGRYSIPQEEELADAKRPDFRWHGVGFDAPVPVELKLADNWSGPKLFERLRVQLCGDYLRDGRSRRGIYLLVYRGAKSTWDMPDGKSVADFDELVSALQAYWSLIARNYPSIDEILVIGIDLTKRAVSQTQVPM